MPPCKRADAYLNKVCNEVRWKQAHEVIRRDLSDHMEDQTEAYMRGGMDGEAAAERAVQEMGDPVDVGLLLDASYRPRIEWSALIPLCLLALMGAALRLLVYNMSIPYQWVAFGTAVGLGGAGFLLLLRLNLYKAVRRAGLLLALFLLCTLIVPYLRRTSRLFDYQFIQYLWLLYPVVYGLLVYRLRGTGFFGVLLSCALFGIPILLCVNAVHLTCVCESVGGLGCFAVLLTAIWKRVFGGNRWIALAFVVLGTALSILVFCIAEPYRLYRMLALWDPARDPRGTGWSILRIREIAASLRPIGPGRPLSPDAYALVGEFSLSHYAEGRDYMLSFLMYHYGYLVMLPPMACIAAFLIFAVRRAARLQSVLARMLSNGIVSVFAAQTALSLLAIFGYPLCYGAFFPFLSYGNSAFLVNLLLTGMLTSLFRTDTLFTDTAVPNRRRLRIRFD